METFPTDQVYRRTKPIPRSEHVLGYVAIALDVFVELPILEGVE